MVSGHKTRLPHDDVVQLDDVVFRRERRTTLADDWTRTVGNTHCNITSQIMYNITASYDTTTLFLVQSAVTAQYRNCPKEGSCRKYHSVPQS